MKSERGFVVTLGASPVCNAQARVLGRLLRDSFPDVPRAAIGRTECLRGLARAGWTTIATEDPLLQRGFESKLHVWRYTPFAESILLDVDILPVVVGESVEEIFRELIESKLPVSYYAFDAYRLGLKQYQTADFDGLRRRGVQRLWVNYGGGHYFWRTGDASREVFEKAARIADEKWPEVGSYKIAAGGEVASDEIVMGIVMGMLFPTEELPLQDVISGAGYWMKGGHLADRRRVAFLHFYGNQMPFFYIIKAWRLGAGVEVLGLFVWACARKAMELWVKRYIKRWR